MPWGLLRALRPSLPVSPARSRGHARAIPGLKIRGCFACRDATCAAGTMLPRLSGLSGLEAVPRGLCGKGGVSGWGRRQPAPLLTNSRSVTSWEISLGSHIPAVPNYPPSISSWLFVAGLRVPWQLGEFALL